MIHFIGAGPGAADLITVRGAELLQKAGIIVYAGSLVNVELVSVNAGARAAALSSGRADGVFWFWYDKQTKTPRDVPAGVELTEPYYTYDTFMYVGKRLH